jgi:hypothetical protein
MSEINKLKEIISKQGPNNKNKLSKPSWRTIISPTIKRDRI